MDNPDQADNPKRIAVYLRCSTSEQTTESQKEVLAAAISGRFGVKWGEVKVYEDKGLSGARADRAELLRMMEDCRSGRVDAVYAYKLDRIGRSTSHLLRVMDELRRHGVALICPTQGIDTTESSPQGQLMGTILAAFAEFERSLIRERVKSGMEAAKARGVQLGRPEGKAAKSKKRIRAEKLLRDDRLTYDEIAGAVGAHRTTVWRWYQELDEVSQTEEAESDL